MLPKFELIPPKELPGLVAKQSAAFKSLIKQLRKLKPAQLDTLINSAHIAWFDQIDCLDCGNCCRSLGPRLSPADIDSLAQANRVKPAKFIDSHLRIDEDGDYVFQQMPCPFLAADNYCMVYEKRPKACRDYPHTHQRNLATMLQLTLKNAETCPVVYGILSELLTRKS